MISTPLRVFYAYPDRPPDLTETLEGTIREFNQSGLMHITSWRNLPTTGKIVIDAILKEIRNSAIFACDLTYINHNVLFELGYAIGCKKKVWITLNPAISNAERNYRKLNNTLVPIGYSPYANKGEVLASIYKEQLWEDTTSTLLGSYNEPSRHVTRPNLLFLRSNISTDASIRLADFLYKSSLFPERIIDDPNETPSEGLQWYINSIHQTDAIIAHLASNIHEGGLWHNAKCSFVCGLALGMENNVFMLAHEPFECPFDYQQLLRTHDSAATCRRLAADWLDQIRSPLTSYSRDLAGYRGEEAASVALQELSAGQFLAENEYGDAEQYFVSTSAYQEALSGRTAIFVGRKGAGKTASLYALERELRRDSRNHVCVIKPVEYEIDGIVRVPKQSIARSEKGFLVESLWKLLIYGELARSLVNDILNRPQHHPTSPDEDELIKFMEMNDELMEESFSIKLQQAIDPLYELERESPGVEQRRTISEFLHVNLLGRLRTLLGNVLHRSNRVAILVDNLDKAWRDGDDMVVLSDLIFGLLSVCNRIIREFRNESVRNKPVDFSLTVFLRSDIFFSHSGPIWREGQVGVCEDSLGRSRTIDEGCEREADLLFW